MSTSGGWNNQQRRGLKPKTTTKNNNNTSVHEKRTSESMNRVQAVDERQNNRRCQNRSSATRRRRGWSMPPENNNLNCFVKQWSLNEGLRKWKEAGKHHCRYFYGTGSGQVLLERDMEEGIWKVMTVPGCRFSPFWLDAILDWAREYQQALIDLNEECMAQQQQQPQPQPQCTASEVKNQDSNSQTAPVSRSVQEEAIPLHHQKTDGSDLSNSRNQMQGRDKGGQKRTNRMLTHSKNGISYRIRMFFTGKICISLRCERMGLTDVELDMISKWHKQNASVLSIVKLWLFDNRISDTGAKYIAQLINSELLEIHVSHNSMSNSGAQQIMTAASSTREISNKPFWLRMEWNMINHEELKKFIAEMEKEKGVVVDIPRFHLRRSRGKASSCLINERKMAHLRLPWIQCQRQRPSEAPVLMQAKTSWQENTNNTLLADIECVKSRRSGCMEVMPSSSTSLPSKTVCHDMPPPFKGLNHKVVADGLGSGGPLLVFPDTSALLGLIGCKVKTGSCPFLSFEWLDGLCQKSNFGRCIPANERVFFVLCDSVMKQLDGLKKHSAHVGLCVRKLVNSGLEKYGPAGQDFLTILGAHEGEGIIVDRNAEVLDSRSQHVFNKGQAIDLKIVEVALFFQQELCQAASQFQTSIDEPSFTDQLPNAKNPFCFPVVLFSNDNVQLMAAKSHGLPAFRYTDLQKCNHSREIITGRRPLTASVLRTLIGRKATTGLGARARKSLQDEFDGIVACMKHLMESYEDARNLLGQAREILEGDSTNALNQLKELLAVGSQEQSSQHKPKSDKRPGRGSGGTDDESSSSENISDGDITAEVESVYRTSSEDEDSPICQTTAVDSDEPKSSDSTLGHSSTSDTAIDEGAASDSETLPLVRAKLIEWEGLVKSYQHPSRILRWTRGHLCTE